MVFLFSPILMTQLATDIYLTYDVAQFYVNSMYYYFRFPEYTAENMVARAPRLDNEGEYFFRLEHSFDNS